MASTTTTSAKKPASPPPPDHRYYTARACDADGVLPSFRRDDKPTWTIWKFLQKREAAYEPKQRAKFLRDYSFLLIAFRLHHGKMKHLRPLIEAYLLAGADDKSIAERLAVPPEAISWFRVAFYDVEHLRESPQYVLLHLIRVVDDEGQTTLDPHRLWKILGYVLGPDALDRLFYDPVADQRAFKSGGLAAWFSQKTQAVLQSKQLIAASNVNPDDQKQIPMLLKLLLQEARSQRQSEEPSFNQYEEIVEAMLQGLPWNMGPELTPEPVRTWDENESVELRDDELLLVAAGEKPLSELQELKGFEFPLDRDTTRKDTPVKNEDNK